MNPNINHKSVIRVAMLAGQIMLENGAETYRVEDTMERICKASGITYVDTFATPTGIFISTRTGEYDYSTSIKRVRNRTINLYKIFEVNNISRKLVNKDIDFTDALKLLENLNSEKQMALWLLVLSAGLCSGTFALLFGGSLTDGIITTFSGALIQLLSTFTLSKNISYFLGNMASGAIAAIIGIVFAEILNQGNIDKIIIGSIIPLLPGVAITNAIRDTIHGDLVYGTVRGVEALLIAVSIAAGVGIVFKTWFILTGGFTL